MSKRKRSTPARDSATTRTCAAAGCSTQVNLPLSQVPLCSPCQTRLVELSTTDDLHWFTCHIETSFIRWSSHPEILPPTPPPLGIPLSLPENYTNEQALSNAAQAIHNADAVLVVAGAGMSCDSGLPDYRGAEGFYRMGGQDVKMNMVDFHPERGADFLLSMGFITTMIQDFRQKQPHEGYRVLHRLAQAKSNPSSSSSSSSSLPSSSSSSSAQHFVLTSNIDAYFLRTGFEGTNVYESHGNCNLLQCTEGGTWDDSCTNGSGASIWAWPETYFSQIEVGSDLKITPETKSLLPKCINTKCDCYARPHISHSTDYPEDIVPTRKKKQEQALVDWLKSIETQHLVVIEVGCGESVHSLRVETEIMVGKRMMSTTGGTAATAAPPSTTLIRIDPGNANVPAGHIGIQMKAMAALIGIEERLGQLNVGEAP